jgi:hypothetical protein
MANRPTGSIAVAREYEAERREKDAQEAAAEREAKRQRSSASGDSPRWAYPYFRRREGGESDD